MTPHKHAEAIKAWADGAKIEFKSKNGWQLCNDPGWYDDYEYRVAPTPKPEVVNLYYAKNGYYSNLMVAAVQPNLKLTFDGETGKLKAAEVIE